MKAKSLAGADMTTIMAIIMNMMKMNTNTKKPLHAAVDMITTNIAMSITIMMKSIMSIAIKPIITKMSILIRLLILRSADADMTTTRMKSTTMNITNMINIPKAMKKNQSVDAGMTTIMITGISINS